MNALTMTICYVAVFQFLAYLSVWSIAKTYYKKQFYRILNETEDELAQQTTFSPTIATIYEYTDTATRKLIALGKEKKA